jgi:hypothetical protein
MRGQRLDTGEPGLRNREREGERAGEVTGADRLAPLGSEREREGARKGELPLTGGSAYQAARARGLAGLSGPTGLLSPFPFLCIFLFLFYFFFYRVFKSKFKLGFKFK